MKSLTITVINRSCRKRILFPGLPPLSPLHSTAVLLRQQINWGSPNQRPADGVCRLLPDFQPYCDKGCRRKDNSLPDNGFNAKTADHPPAGHCAQGDPEIGKSDIQTVGKFRRVPGFTQQPGLADNQPGRMQYSPEHHHRHHQPRRRTAEPDRQVKSG